MDRGCAPGAAALRPITVNRWTGFRVDRCPVAIIRDAPAELVAMVGDLAEYERTHCYPLPGGQLDQCSRWWRAKEESEAIKTAMMEAKRAAEGAAGAK